MIYQDSFFAKERKRAYLDQGVSSRRAIGISLFTAMLTFAVHMILQTLTESVLSSAVPELMQKSYFSVASLYVALAYVIYIVYFMVHFEYLTFAEVRRNKWYIPVKQGFSPVRMILAKLGARLFDVLLLYSIGYAGTVLMATFLKYPFVLSYLIQLYIAGILDMCLIVLCCMTFSLFMPTKTVSRWLICITAVILFTVKANSGFYALLSDRTLMFTFRAFPVLIQNSYPLFGAILAALCIGISIYRARRVAMYESFDFYWKDHDYPKTYKLIAGGVKLSGSEADIRRRLRHKKVADVLLNCLLALIIALLLAFNVLVLTMSLISPDDESSPIGVIPYVFQSNMMEPKIMYNDLTVFQVIDRVSPIEIGDVVMFKYAGEPYVARVTQIDGDTVKTDIDYYPSAVKQEAYARTTTRGEIYARLLVINRWLGAIVLFANTTIGRLLMLLLPCLLIFFYKPITEFVTRISQDALKD